MKKLLIIIFLYCCYTKSFSQTNLVPNYSFEDTLGCPINSGEISNAKYWFSPNNPSSSDYFNACAIGQNVPYSPLGMGYQYAKTGNGYAGIILYSPLDTNYKEYIEIKLSNQLIIDKKYCINFYVNLSNFSKFALNKIGLFLSNDSILQNSWQIINGIPQIYNNFNVLQDTLEWVNISGEYLAKGGENFLTIGCFSNYSLTNIDTVGYPIDVDSYAYYYIDDVSVTLCPDTTGVNELEESNFNLNIFPNPSNGNNININLPIKASADYEILNVLGSVVAKGKILNADKIEIDISNIAKGCYFVKIISQEDGNSTPQNLVGRFVKE